jgi:hypothetical protein
VVDHRYARYGTVGIRLPPPAGAVPGPEEERRCGFEPIRPSVRRHALHEDVKP